MSRYRSNSVLLLKGEKKDNAQLDSYISVLGQQGGYDVTCIPVLDFHFINVELLREALRHPDDYSCLLLSSQRAVEAVSKADDAETGGDLLSGWSKKRTFVVGSATGELAESIGLRVKGAESGNSEKLATILIDDVLSDGCPSSKPVLFPCGNLKLETLPSSLQAAGLTVHCLTVYETTPDSNLRQNLKAFKSNDGCCAEYIVFYSPSGVKYAFHLLQQLGFLIHDVKLVAIGPTTAKAIVANGGTVWGTSVQPNAEHLLQLLLLSQTQKSASS